tara:strand:- start:7887 stop:8213 length:327 start_codon:yes stop_codon:yes gene_type:complete
MNLEKNNEIENKESIDYKELEKLRKTIENLNSNHHLEIAKILKNNNIKLTENINGIFINLNSISNDIIIQIKNYIQFIKRQENMINIDESKKETLENIYFKKIPEILE